MIRQGPGPENRFSLISHEISRNPEISLRTKGVYIFLRSHSEGWSMSVARIADALGVSPDTISKAVNELEDHGFLVRSQTVGEDGRFGSSEYVVMSEPLPKKPLTVNTVHGETVDRKIRSHKKTIPKKTNLEEEQPPNPQGGETDLFDEFWDTYDRKVNKPGAKKAWTKAVKKTDPDHIVSQASLFIASQKRKGKHPEFTPHPSTWLNQERWADEVEVLSFDDPESPVQRISTPEFGEMPF